MLIDTDVLVWYLRGNEHARKVLEREIPFEISAVTWAELIQGVRNKNEIRELKSLMKAWNTGILHVNEDISVRALLLVTDFGLSHAVRFADALIAATAIEYQETLLTGNTKHYSCIPMLDMKSYQPTSG